MVAAIQQLLEQVIVPGRLVVPPEEDGQARHKQRQYGPVDLIHRGARGVKSDLLAAHLLAASGRDLAVGGDGGAEPSGLGAGVGNYDDGATWMPP